MNTKKNLLASTIAFFMGSAVQGVVAQEDAGGQEENGWALEEIVVTASKRGVGESLQDASTAISVLSKEAIEDRGLVSMADYLAIIPGASYVATSVTDKRVVLRGLSLGPFDKQGTTAVYLGEIPLSSSAANVFNINLVDIERVEVVKGPQGTLYGSSALGGIVRNIPISPNLEKYEGSLKVGLGNQEKSSDTNKEVVGIFNVPLIENQLAFRLASYRYDNAGYIDIVSSQEQDAIAASIGSSSVVKNDSSGSTNKGYRASLLWSPRESINFSLIHGKQKNNVDGRPDIKIAAEKYIINALNRAPSESSETDYTNILIEVDLSWATLISSSSMLNNEGDTNSDFFSRFPGPILGPIDSQSYFETEIKTQEVRLASNLSGSWQYLLGLFYEKATLDTKIRGSWIGDLVSNPFGTEVIEHALTSVDYDQAAFFGEITYQINDDWAVTVGGRHFQYDRTDEYLGLDNALFNGPDSKEVTDRSGNTYKANLAYNPNDLISLYTQWSEGFRLGRGQSLPPLDLCDTDNNRELDFGTGAILTKQIESDTTENIEFGVKLSLDDNRLQINSAIFRTDWDNLPFLIQPKDSMSCITGITNNVGSARAEGFEFESSYSLQSWIVSLSASYVDSKWTKAQLPVEKGERLVYVPRTNASLGVQYSFDLGPYSTFIRADVGYVGEFETGASNLDFSPAGDYIDANLRLGASYEQWSMNFYVNNLAGNDDIRVQSSGSGENSVGTRAIPRRFGLEVKYVF